MKRYFWLGGLVLSVAGWANRLPAQEVWRPIARAPVPVSLGGSYLPPPNVIAPSELIAPAPASLGRPVPLDFPASPTPATAGNAFRDLVPVNFPPPGPPTAEPRLAPVVVASQRASAVVEEDLTDFGVDRRVTVLAPQPIRDAAVTPASAQVDPIPSVLPDPATIPQQPHPLVHNVDPLHAHWYADVEYLLWTAKRDTAPPLVTTSTNPADAGRLIPGNTTQILFGGDLDQNPRHGARFTAGCWLDMWRSEAIEVQGFFLAQSSATFADTSSQHPVLARPFFSLNSRTEISELTTSPGLSTGSVRVNSPSDLWGIEASLRCCVCSDCNFHFDVFGGPRLLHLGESLEVDENILGLPSGPDPRFVNKQITAVDRFATDNYFIGGQLGAEARWTSGPWSVMTKGKLGLGGVVEETRIVGGQRFVDLRTGQVSSFQGGLLALSSNIGTHRTGNFAVVPELEVQLGYQVSEHLRAFVGYDFLYWSSVVRPGHQIDRVLDETLIPNFTTNVQPAGQNRPAVLNRESDFWVQGLTVGLELRY